MKLTRLPPDVFDRLMATTRFKEQARIVLRAIFVDGRQQTIVADEHGMTKQRVNRLAGFLERAYIATDSSGNAMVKVSLELPETLAMELDGLMGAMQNCTDEIKKTAALDKARAGVRSATKHLSQ